MLEAMSDTAAAIKEGIARAQLFARSLAETQEFLDSVSSPDVRWKDATRTSKQSLLVPLSTNILREAPGRARRLF